MYDHPAFARTELGDSVYLHLTLSQEIVNQARRSQMATSEWPKHETGMGVLQVGPTGRLRADCHAWTSTDVVVHNV